MLPLDTRALNCWAVFWSSLYCECLSINWPNCSHFDYDTSVAFRERGAEFGRKGDTIVNWGEAALLTEEGEDNAG